MQQVFWQTGRFLRRHDFPAKAIALIAIMISFVIVLRSLPLEGPLSWLQEKVDELGFWAPLVFVVLFIVTTAVMLPGVVLNVASGALFGPFWGGVLSSIGSTSAAAVSFLIGRYLAHDYVARKVHRYPRLEAIYHALGKEEGWKIVAAVRLSHSLPFGLQNFLLGVSPVGFVSYLLTTWLITLPGIFVFAYVGYLAGSALSAPDTGEVTGPWYWVIRVGGLLIAGGALFYLGRLAFKAIREKASLRVDKDEPKDTMPRSLRTWPWGTFAALVAALIFLGGAVWCYLERESLRQLLSAASGFLIHQA